MLDEKIVLTASLITGHPRRRIECTIETGRSGYIEPSIGDAISDLLKGWALPYPFDGDHVVCLASCIKDFESPTDDVERHEALKAFKEAANQYMNVWRSRNGIERR